jgi:hypothetical protein
VVETVMYRILVRMTTIVNSKIKHQPS